MHKYLHACILTFIHTYIHTNTHANLYSCIHTSCGAGGRGGCLLTRRPAVRSLLPPKSSHGSMCSDHTSAPQSTPTGGLKTWRTLQPTRVNSSNLNSVYCQKALEHVAASLNQPTGGGPSLRFPLPSFRTCPHVVHLPPSLQVQVGSRWKLRGVIVISMLQMNPLWPRATTLFWCDRGWNLLRARPLRHTRGGKPNKSSVDVKDLSGLSPWKQEKWMHHVTQDEVRERTGDMVHQLDRKIKQTILKQRIKVVWKETTSMTFTDI